MRLIEFNQLFYVGIRLCSESPGVTRARNYPHSLFSSIDFIETSTNCPAQQAGVLYWYYIVDLAMNLIPGNHIVNGRLMPVIEFLSTSE